MPYVKPAILPSPKLEYVAPKIKKATDADALPIDILAVGGKWVKP